MRLDLGVVASVLALASLAVMTTARLNARRGVTWAVLFGSGVAAFLPLDGLALHGYVSAHLGTLSATSGLWLALSIGRRLGGPELPSGRDRRALLGGVLVAALFLYPMSLGLSFMDPYRLGYASAPFIVLVGGIALLAALRRLPVTAGALVLALLGYGLALGESPNLWDYLIDPWIALYAALIGVAALTRSVRGRSSGVRKSRSG